MVCPINHIAAQLANRARTCIRPHPSAGLAKPVQPLVAGRGRIDPPLKCT